MTALDALTILRRLYLSSSETVDTQAIWIFTRQSVDVFIQDIAQRYVGVSIKSFGRIETHGFANLGQEIATITGVNIAGSTLITMRVSSVKKSALTYTFVSWSSRNKEILFVLMSRVFAPAPITVWARRMEDSILSTRASRSPDGRRFKAS